MFSPVLSPTKEAEAQELADRAQQAVADEILQIARLLVSKETPQLFGQTEFDVRDLVLRIGAKVVELHLAKKKTATRGAVSSARTASKRRSSRTTGPRRP